MNTYKLKRLLIIVSIVMLGLSDGVSARKNRYPCPTFNLKRHEFGLGVSTTLLDSKGLVNSFRREVSGLESLPGYCTLRLHETGFFSLFFDYQYRFNDNWSLEARLKYKYRNSEMHLEYITDELVGLTTDGIYLTFSDLSLPVTCNYRWVTRTGSSIEFVGGMGVCFLGLGGTHNLPFYYNDIEDTHGETGLYYERSVDFFGLVGIQFEIPYGLFTLKPFVSYSYSPIQHSLFKIRYLDDNNNLIKEYNSAQINTSELEVGIIFQL